jgi:hypothetical protein
MRLEYNLCGFEGESRSIHGIDKYPWREGAILPEAIDGSLLNGILPVAIEIKQLNMQIGVMFHAMDCSRDASRSSYYWCNRIGTEFTGCD